MSIFQTLGKWKWTGLKLESRGYNLKNQPRIFLNPYYYSFSSYKNFGRGNFLISRYFCSNVAFLKIYTVNAVIIDFCSSIADFTAEINYNCVYNINFQKSHVATKNIEIEENFADQNFCMMKMSNNKDFKKFWDGF